MNASISSRPPVEANPPVITNDPIDIAKVLNMAHHAKAGGIVLFSGEVRDNHDEKIVKHLEYEAFIPMATKMIHEIIKSAIDRWGLQFAYCVHRIGIVGISECAVAVVTSHAHRKEAYEANQYIIDRVKHEVPIWKNEFYEDGSSLWGGNCHC